MRVRVKVTPDARREKFEKIGDGVFAVAVKEPAERNEANAQVRKILARHFHVPEGKVRMLTGARGKTKTFDITR